MQTPPPVHPSLVIPKAISSLSRPAQTPHWCCGELPLQLSRFCTVQCHHSLVLITVLVQHATVELCLVLADWAARLVRHTALLASTLVLLLLLLAAIRLEGPHQVLLCTILVLDSSDPHCRRGWPT